ncbi:hypothetical protein RRG08_035486 [Elysia crispata]|uniref:RNase H type-1 domain-containing protein n=1 Tax=Elysia crispata TaxID=231223 RepID=A0AAE1E3Z0_9GAST|nr:hypothetical protein RRG08_035486 [Elysia crispata]
MEQEYTSNLQVEMKNDCIPTGVYSSNFRAEAGPIREGAYRVKKSCTELKKMAFLSDIPSHCGISGNEIAGTLAKDGSKQCQRDKPATYKEAKNAIKNAQRNLWLTKHPHFNKVDLCHQLQRSHQVITFRLRTGHNRLNSHLHTKLGIGASDQCPCLSAAMTVENILLTCPNYRHLRSQTWPEAIIIQRKLYGSLRDLQDTPVSIEETGLSI